MRIVRSHWLVRHFAGLLFVLGIAACTLPGTSQPTAALPTATPPAGRPNAETGPDESAPILIDQPAAGTTLASPSVLSGRLAAVPPEGGLIYRILDAENIVLATGTVTSKGEVGGVGTFEANILYTSLESGPGFLQVVQRSDRTGPAVAVASRSVNLVQNVTTPPTAGAIVPPGGLLPTQLAVVATATPLSPTQPQGQTISFSSPAPGTQVGSPLTITGNTGRFPFQGSLDYRVVDAANRSLGTGAFPVSGAIGQPTSFVTELRFTLPPAGGPIRVDVYDQDTSSGQVAAIAALNLTIAATPPTPGPQQITISSPPAGTTVGSPVVITGSTTRFPAQGNLKYRMLDQVGNQVGAGTIAVNGSAGNPATFNAALVFALPPGGGPVRLELTDRDTTNGQTLANTVLDMQVAPPATVVPQQQITITSPPPGTQVGSPMTITGSTVNFPGGGSLVYRVFSSANQQIGGGTFPVSGAVGQSANFTAQISFTPPPGGGDLRVEVSDREPNTGNILASANLAVRVAAAPQPTVPQPTATAVASTQVIRVASPAPGAAVGEPLTVIGTTDVAPLDGNLFYVVRDDAGKELGSGTFNTQATTFNAEVRFTPPPVGSFIRITLVDEDDKNRGAVRAQAEVRVQYRPTAYPQPR